MVNTEAFSKRIEKIMKYYDLSAAGFADKIDVGRSSISHILSGRNKPSLEFVMKIIEAFPDVELYWLLNGKGNFPKSEEVSRSLSNSGATNPSTDNNLFTEHSIPLKNEPSIVIKKESEDKFVKKIVIFYSNGTFEVFEN